jgi:hypothetical protein
MMARIREATMTRATMIRLAIGATLLAGLGAGADKPNGSQPAQTEQQLRDKIQALEQEVSSLAFENVQLKEQLRMLQTRLLLNPSRVAPAPRQVPEDWKRQEFNGMTYYLVPLDTGRPATTQPSHR